MAVNVSHQLYTHSWMSGVSRFPERRGKDISSTFYSKKPFRVSLPGEGHTAGQWGGPAPVSAPFFNNRCCTLTASAKLAGLSLLSSHAQKQSLLTAEHLPGSGCFSPLGSQGCPPHLECLIKMKMKYSPWRGHTVAVTVPRTPAGPGCWEFFSSFCSSTGFLQEPHL